LKDAVSPSPVAVHDISKFNIISGEKHTFPNTA
jgi:hypothetical protein